MYQYREARCGSVTTGICPRWLNRNWAIPRSVPMAAFGYGSMIQKPAPTPASIPAPAPPPPDPELSRLTQDYAQLKREFTDMQRRAIAAEQEVVKLEREIVLLKQQRSRSIVPPPPERETQILPIPAPGPITRRPGEATILPIAPVQPRDMRYYPLDDVPVRISIPSW